MDSTILFKEYEKHGWVLVPIEAGRKFPRGVMWNARANCGLPQGWAELGGGAGLAHAYSNTCAIDADQYEAACQALQWGYGIDLEAYFRRRERVEIYSGRKDHGKLLCAMPPGLVLPSAAIRVNGQHALQFRCADRSGHTVQDVLPPSIHPDTGRPYEWRGEGDWRCLEVIAEPLLNVWTELLAPRRPRPAAGAGAGLTATEGEIERALAELDPDMSMAEWIEVGMALHSTGNDGLIDLWDEWSQGSRRDKYRGRGDIEARWRSFSDPAHTAGEPVTLSTLFFRAREARRERGYEEMFHALGQEQPQGEIVPPAAPDAPPMGQVGGGQPAGVAQLLEQAGGLSRMQDSRAILMQCVGLSPVEQRQVLEAVKDRTEMPLGVLREELARLTRELAARTELARGPVFRWLTEYGTPKAHLENFGALLAYYGIDLRYNEMTHESECSVADVVWSQDDWKNQQVTYIKDKMVEVGMPYDRCKELMDAHAAANAYHPFRQSLEAVTWDKRSRWRWVLDTLATPHPELRDLFLRRWLISVVAAVYRTRHQRPPRGVLCLFSRQGKGKTQWLENIVPEGMFREGATLLVGNKDSEKQALGRLLVELGEIEETFKTGRLGLIKAWISKGQDELRTPYAASESTWPRRTVYAGTVNHRDFLKDLTGNTRFWPIEVTQFGWERGLQLPKDDELWQFWAEVKTWFDAGERYHLNSEELKFLEDHNEDFREVSPLEEAIQRHYQWEAPREEWTWVGQLEIYEAVDRQGKYQRNVTLLGAMLPKLLAGYTDQTHAERRYEEGERRRKWLMPPARHLYQNFDVIPGGQS